MGVLNFGKCFIIRALQDDPVKLQKYISKE